MISNAYANKILNVLCGLSDDVSLPTNLYLGLSSTEPTSDKGVVTGEPAPNSYNRIPVGGSSVSPKKFGSADAGVIDNQTEIQFPTCRQGENWGLMKYFFLSKYESKSKVPTSGNSANEDAILWGVINEGNGVSITEETVPTFYEHELKISLDVPLT